MKLDTDNLAKEMDIILNKPGHVSARDVAFAISVSLKQVGAGDNLQVDQGDDMNDGNKCPLCGEPYKDLTHWDTAGAHTLPNATPPHTPRWQNCERTRTMAERMTDERLEEMRAYAALSTDMEVEMVREIDRLRATGDKLPKYADTGKSFIPGRDGYWMNGFTDPIIYTEVCPRHGNDGWIAPSCLVTSVPLAKRHIFYSTEVAAKDKSDD